MVILIARIGDRQTAEIDQNVASLGVGRGLRHQAAEVVELLDRLDELDDAWAVLRVKQRDQVDDGDGLPGQIG